MRNQQNTVICVAVADKRLKCCYEMRFESPKCVCGGGVRFEPRCRDLLRFPRPSWSLRGKEVRTKNENKIRNGRAKGRKGEKRSGRGKLVWLGGMLLSDSDALNNYKQT